MASIGPGITVGGGISFTKAPPPYVTENLSLYYDPSNSESYPGSGTTVYDLSGNGLNGTMANVTYTSPYFSFNGSSSNITTNNNSLLNPGSGDFTMEIWYRMSSPNSFSYLLSKWAAPYNFTELSYAGVRQTTNSNNSYWGGNAGATITTWSGNVNDVWSQSVWVWSVASKQAISYRDGGYVSADSHNSTSINTNSAPLIIGSRNGNQFFFSGRIGVVRLYKKALSNAEVTKNWNATKSLYGL